MKIDPTFEALCMDIDEFNKKFAKSKSFTALPYPILQIIIKYLASKYWFCTRCNEFHPYMIGTAQPTLIKNLTDLKATLRESESSSNMYRTLLACSKWRPKIISDFIYNLEGIYVRGIYVANEDKQFYPFDNPSSIHDVRRSFALNNYAEYPYIIVSLSNSYHVIFVNETVYIYSGFRELATYMDTIQKQASNASFPIIQEVISVKQNIYEFAENFAQASQDPDLFPVRIPQKGLSLISSRYAGSITSSDSIIVIRR